MSGRVQDSLRELETLSNKADINLCSLLALLHGHRMAKSVGMLFGFRFIHFLFLGCLTSGILKLL